MSFEFLCPLSSHICFRERHVPTFPDQMYSHSNTEMSVASKYFAKQISHNYMSTQAIESKWLCSNWQGRIHHTCIALHFTYRDVRSKFCYDINDDLLRKSGNSWLNDQVRLKVKWGIVSDRYFNQTTCVTHLWQPASDRFKGILHHLFLNVCRVH